MPFSWPRCSSLVGLWETCTGAARSSLSRRAFLRVSAWCGVAPNIRQLIVARGLQGIGAPSLFAAAWLLSALLFPRKSAVAPSGRGPDSRRSPLPSVPCWVDGFTEHGFVEMGVFHQCSAGTGRPSSLFVESPESRAGNQGQRLDWPGGLLAAFGLGGVVYALIESVAGRRRSRRGCPDWAAVLGSPLIVADGSAPPVPFPQFQRRQRTHTLFSTPR